MLMERVSKDLEVIVRDSEILLQKDPSKVEDAERREEDLFLEKVHVDPGQLRCCHGDSQTALSGLLMSGVCNFHRGSYRVAVPYHSSDQVIRKGIVRIKEMEHDSKTNPTIKLVLAKSGFWCKVNHLM